MKKGISLGIKIFVSLGLMVFILAKIDLSSLISSLLGARPSLIFTAIACAYLAYVLNTYKWRELLMILKISIPFLTLLALNFTGFFYTLFLSTQISGEVMKAVKLANLKKDLSRVVASITMDRLTSLFALISLSFLSIGIGGVPLFKELRLMWWALAIVMLAILLVMMSILSRRTSMVFERLGVHLFEKKGLSSLRRFASPLWDSLKLYQGHLPSLGLILIYSFIYQLLIVAVNYLVALSIGIRISFINIIWIVGVVSILQLVPFSIGGIGVREGAFLVILEGYGVLYPKALAFSIIVFGINLLMGLIGGGVEMGYHFRR